LSHPSRALIAASLLALALLMVGAARPPRAQAATPCWKTLLNDWYDGRIDGTYPLHCYTDALHHLPSDVKTYSSAADDIERALQSARAAARKQHKKLGPGTLLRPARGGSAKSPTNSKTVTATTPGRKRSKGFAGFADRLDPGSPSALPLPLLVLGGLAIALVAAGGIGLVVQRLRGR